MYDYLKKKPTALPARNLLPSWPKWTFRAVFLFCATAYVGFIFLYIYIDLPDAEVTQALRSILPLTLFLFLMCVVLHNRVAMLEQEVKKLVDKEADDDKDGRL